MYNPGLQPSPILMFVLAAVLLLAVATALVMHRRRYTRATLAAGKREHAPPRSPIPRGKW